MSLEEVDNITDKIKFSIDDVKGLRKLAQNKPLYQDIFNVMCWILLIVFLGLFIATIVNRQANTDYIGILGYFIGVLVFVFACRETYGHIARDFMDPCSNNFVLKTDTRFNLILSFMYYYLRTYITTMINLMIIFIGVYLAYMCIQNVLVTPFDVIHPLEYETIFMKVFMIIYLIISLIMSLLMQKFCVYYLMGEPVFSQKSGNLVILVLFLVCSYGIVYWYDSLSEFWKLIVLSIVNPIFNANELFKHFDMQQVTIDNDQIVSVGKVQLRILSVGLGIVIAYAFLVLPRVDIEKLCEETMMQYSEAQHESADTNKKDLTPLIIKDPQYQQLQARFMFGYFIVTMAVLWLHFGNAFVMVKTVAVNSK